MSRKPHQGNPKRRAVIRTAWLLGALVLAIYLFFIGRAFIQGGL